jgi:acetyltransferase
MPGLFSVRRIWKRRRDFPPASVKLLADQGILVKQFKQDNPPSTTAQFNLNCCHSGQKIYLKHCAAVLAKRQEITSIQGADKMSFERIFKAEAVAIIGAPKDDAKRGYQDIKILLDEKYDGTIYPVDSAEKTVLGLKCYQSILDIPGKVDLALITTPAHTLKDILGQLGQKDVAGAVVLAKGFGELGEEGKKFEEEIVHMARENGLRIIGPNTTGILNIQKGLNLAGLQKVPQGSIALLTQSGNIALNLITEAGLKSEVGFSYYVGVGNEADIKFHEYLEYFTQDPDTKVILMYVEGLRDGRKFLQQASETTRVKPIVIYKSGRSAKGHKVVGTHTGALAGISAVSQTAFKRAGTIVVNHPGEMFPVAEALALLPMLKENSIAILADGGGHAAIAADYLTEAGIILPELEEETRDRLAAILPANSSLANPIDVAGVTDKNPAIFADCAEILLEDKNIHGLLIVGLFGGYGIRFNNKLGFIEEDAAHRLGKLMESSGKPIMLHSLYNYAKPHSLALLRYYNIPVYDSLEIACKCMEALHSYGSYRREFHKEVNFQLNWGANAVDEGQEIIDRALAEGRKALLEHEAKELFRLQGVTIPTYYLATSEDEAVKFAAELGFNVAMKITSPDIPHKTDAGGVKLGLRDEQEVRTAFRKIINNANQFRPGAQIRGCLVSPMADKGIEVILGTKVDEQFGPIIMFGLGGIMVSVMKDVSFRVLPVSEYWAASMIDEIKSSVIFNGFRGRPSSDKQAIVKLIMKISEIVQAYPLIHEIDLNPVIVHNKGLTIVDARIILRG